MVTIKKFSHSELVEAGVLKWPIWEKEVSKFDWFYDEEEHCYILQGNVTVQTSEGLFKIGPGDYVIFAKGLKCIWDIREDIKKHYMFVG